MEQVQHSSLAALLAAVLKTAEERGIGLVDIVPYGRPLDITVGFTVHGPGECMVCHFMRVADIEVDSLYRSAMTTEDSRAKLASQLELGRLPDNS